MINNKRKFSSHLFIFIIFLFTVQFISKVENAQSLPAFNVNTNLTSVSGLSSGGFMAVQMQVAYSSIMIGAGVFAGGQYNCAEGSLSKAQVNCMYAAPAPDPQTAIKTTNSRSSSGSIDNVNNLANQRVYLFSGTKDTTVKPAVMDALEEYYANYITSSDSILYDNTLNAAHTLPTVFETMNNCGISNSPYISYCGYDGAGYVLNHIFDYQLNPRSALLTGEIMEFDQTEFYSKDISSISMADTGYAYVPKECSLGTSCLVHVVFHGCLQSYTDIGMDYVNYSGYNEWAETNNIIILYPQTIPSTLNPQNPNACWDWWGYTSATNYDTKSGAQMQVIKSMIDRVGGNFANFLSAPLVSFVNSTDNSIAIGWNTVDNASEYSIYRNTIFLAQVDGNELQFNDQNLSSGTSYEYAVAAVASTGQQGPLSSHLIASTTGSPPPLSSPSNLSATEISSTNVVLVWEFVLAADRYNVYRNSQYLATTNQNTYTDLNLTPSTTYTYTINAENASGTGAFSSPLSITTNDSFQCASFTDNNYNHVIKGRAYAKLGIVYANGSDEYMGLYNIFIYTILSETSPNYYILGSC